MREEKIEQSRSPEEKEVLEIDRERLAEEEKTLLSKFRGKAGLMARAFILLTVLAARECSMRKPDIETLKEQEQSEEIGQVNKQEISQLSTERWVDLVTKDPWYFILNKKHRKNIPQKAQELLEEFLEANIDSELVVYRVVSNFEDIKNFSNAKELFRKCAENLLERKRYISLIDYSDLLLTELGESYVEQVLEAAVEDVPYSVLATFDQYKKFPNAEKILQRAVEGSIEVFPRGVLKHSAYFKRRPYTESVIEAVARKDPCAALEFFNRYKDLANAKEILEQAAKDAVQKNPLKVLDCIDSFINEPYAQEIIKTAVQRDAWVALKHAEHYIDQPYASETIEAAAQERPEAALCFYENYKRLSNAEKILQQAAEKVAQDNPRAALQQASSYVKTPYAKEVIETAAKNSPRDALIFASQFMNLPGSAAIIKQAAETVAEEDPFIALSYSGEYTKKPYAQKIVETAAKNHPGEAMTVLRQYPEDIRKKLQKSKDPAVKVILDIYNSDLSFSLKIGTSMLIQKILSENISLEEAAKIALNEQDFFSTLMEIRGQPNHLAKVAIENKLSELSLQRISVINELHEASDEKRFESVKNTSPEELYALMVYGEEEVFTSSFNGLFNRLLERMKKNNISGDQLLEKLGHNKFRTFIKLNAGFNRLNEFLATMNKDSQKNLLENFAKGIDKEQDKLTQAVVIADAFSMIKDTEILKVFQKTIKEEYDRVSKGEDKESRAIYGLLAGMFGKKAVINEAWIKEMAEKYRLPSLIELSSSKLFNEDRTNIQQYFFYNDKDGRASFQSFLAQYKNKPEWKIERTENHVLIKSSKENRRIEIYANLPEKDDEGLEKISEILEGKNIETIVIVHRGHSYHVEKTIRRIPSIAKIVSLGSCGGYHNISAVLKRAPEAHIISTKGTGTMRVNDPLFRMLNGEIISGKNINWPKFWTEAEKRLGGNKDFYSYIPPHKNLGALFLRAYNKILKSKT